MSKSNSSKSNTTNTMLTLNEVYALFVDGVHGVPCKLNYSDAKSQPYCGFNDFSVNMKKSSYNVYMSDANVTICKSIDGTLESVHNDCDNTKQSLRCNLITFTDTDTLKKCINAVAIAKCGNA